MHSSPSSNHRVTYFLRLNRFKFGTLRGSTSMLDCCYSSRHRLLDPIISVRPAHPRPDSHVRQHYVFNSWPPIS